MCSISGNSTLDLFFLKLFCLFSFPVGEIKRGVGGDETTGELGGIDGTGMREVDGVGGRDTEHIGCKITDDTADNVEVIGVIEDGEVDVDDEMDEEAATEGWCVIAWIESVDDGRDPAGLVLAMVLLAASPSDTW